MMCWTKSLILSTVLAWFALAYSVDKCSSDQSISFEKTIRPILKQHCWHCHGEESKLEGGFDARLAKYLLRGGESGPAIEPGNHQASLLYQRIASHEMPPGEKKVSVEQLASITTWIDAGAKTASLEPDSLAIGDVILDSDRRHWSFEPIVRPPLPDVLATSRVRTPIDRFLLSKLESQNQSMGEDANRQTLVRRLSFDLLGLPADSAFIETVVSDEAPDWYEKLVDQLLASPEYGERWGRHWLDVVGYADSNGYTEKDIERKWAWRYRDYVIRSMNADKPWNESILEQLAGDELIATAHDSLSEADADKLIATGYLRMAPDGTAEGGIDLAVATNDVMAETIKIVSSSILGLTVGCAQCHSHRYDPISHLDYYRFRAIFEPAINWKAWKTPDQRLVSLWTSSIREQSVNAAKELKEVADQRNAELDQLVQDTFDRELAKLPLEIQEEARLVRKTSEAMRSPEQKALIKTYPFLNVDRGSVYLYLPDRLRAFNKKWDEATEAAKKKQPAEDFVHCLTEPTVGECKPPETFLFYRGDHNSPRNAVEPSELSVLLGGSNPIATRQIESDSTGRRLAYAKHLTDGKHPLVARVLVNRFWMHHFGRGLVTTPSDFGLLGQLPSHPELLDWLADEFMRHDWSLKHLHRLILCSTAFRQSSVRRPELDALDPENTLLGRMSLRRLESEVIRDALLDVSGKISHLRMGSPVTVTPDEVGQFVVGKDTRDTAGRPTGKKVEIGEDEYRRSVYVQARRSMPLGVLEPFDNPIMSPNCDQRARSTVAPQSLMMINNQFVVECANSFAMRLENEVASSDLNRVIRGWMIAYGRTPTDREIANAVSFLNTKPLVNSDGTEAEREFRAKQWAEENHLRLVQFCQALLCSNAFLYVE
jgi:hypothetical protein